MYEIEKMPSMIDIGYTGEIDFRTVQIDMSEWVEKVPDGTPILMYVRPGESEPYALDINYEDNIITWSVTDDDLGTREGTGLLQVWFGVEDEDQVLRKLGMSAVVATLVHLSIAGEGHNSSTVQIPWLKEVTEIKNAILGYDYEAESWATGKRGGTDVGSDDPAYHNNAKYYSDQASDAKTDAVAAKVAAEAAQEAAETAASTDLVAWLEENITNPDSPPLDRTLSSSSAATPADITGDLKSALTGITGCSKISFTDGKRYATNGTSVTEGGMTTDANFRCAFLSCSPGDKFTISGTGGASSTLWAWIKSDNSILSRGTQNLLTKDKLLVAPTGAAAIVINDKNKTMDSFTGDITRQQTVKLTSAVREIPNIALMIQNANTVDAVSNSGFYKKDDGTYVSSSSLQYKRIDCSAKEIYIIKTYTGSTANPINFYNGEPSSSTYLGEFYPIYFPDPNADTSMITLVDQVVIVPTGATVMVVNNSITSPANDFYVKKIENIDLTLYNELEKMFAEVDPVSITTSLGFYRADTGAYYSTSSYKYCIVPVTAGEKYLVTATYGGTAQYGLFYNGTPSAETFVGIAGERSQTIVTVVDEPVVIPTGVTYLVVDTASDAAISVKKVTGNYSESLKQKIYYDIEDDVITLVTCYSKANDLITILRKKGANNLFDFGTFYISPNSSDYPSPAKTGATLINVGTDFLGPFKVRAVNNIDGDATDSHDFTGGNHAYNGDATGTATARTTDIRFWIDGKGKTEGNGYCSSVRITWKNYVQAYNTKKSDGTGREVLVERHELYFDGYTWYVFNEITPLEDVVVELYYGMQIALPAPNYIYARFVGGPNREQFTINSGWKGNGDIHSCNMIRGTSSTGSNLAVMTVDGTFDLGKRENCEGPDGMIMSGTKLYSVLINTDTEMDSDDLYAFKGTYQFLSEAQ